MDLDDDCGVSNNHCKNDGKHNNNDNDDDSDNSKLL